MPIDFTTDDMVVLPSGVDVSSGNYTIFLWTNATAAGSNCWFSMGNSATNLEYIFLDSQGGTRYATRGGAGANAIAATVPTATVDVSDGNPHSVAAVRASSTSHTVYVDGTNSATDSTADTAPTVDRFNLGVLGRDGDVNFLVGCIEEVYVWSTDLTAAEIELIHNAKVKGIGLGIKSVNLVAYYSMDDGPDGTSADGDTIRDGSGNGNNGTGDDGGNNTGLTFVANQLLSYPPYIMTPQSISVAAPAVTLIAERGPFRGINRGIQRGAA